VLRTLTLTTLAMLAFASNSLLCRLALADATIDAASFTTVRLVAGAVLLALLLHSLSRSPQGEGRGEGTSSLTLRQQGEGWGEGFYRRADAISGLMLFLYAICFSLAYNSLTASTGALILFGAVQFTMLLNGLRIGERPGARFWTGFALAVLGLVYLLSPGLHAPAPHGALLMAIAGVAWGIYSLRGRAAGDPLRLTRDNFILAVPCALLASAVFYGDLHLSTEGIVLATISGAVTSGLGYVVWYAALPRLGASRAAIVQLSVPAITAAGAVILLAEPLNVRLVLSSAAILGGIALALRAPMRRAGA
jgi:drug/metabolite transporter (DMT)-like permease